MRRLFAAPRRPIQWTPDEARARDASLVDVKPTMKIGAVFVSSAHRIMQIETLKRWMCGNRWRSNAH